MDGGAEGHRGFTLIEVLIVVVVIGILAVIAFPSFERFIVKSNRADAHAALQNIQLLQERYRRDNGRYGASINDIGGDAQSAKGLYDLSIEEPNPVTSDPLRRASYTAVADATGRQKSREETLFGTECLAIELTVTFAGVTKKEPTCWPQ